MKNNYLQTLKNDTFLGLGKIEYLDMSSNDLVLMDSYNVVPIESSEIDIGDFAKVQSLNLYPFSGLKTLETLNLKHNRIDNIFPVFNDLANLKYLDLSSNVIKAWNERIFSYTTQMKVLNLNYNQIETFTTAMMEDFESCNYTEILLVGNDFSCTCALKAFVSQGMLSRCLDYANMKCSDNKNISISSFLKDMPCSDNEVTESTWSKTAVSISAGIFIVILIFGFVYAYRR